MKPDRAALGLLQHMQARFAIVAEGTRYLMASAVALCVDLGTFALFSWWWGGWYYAAAGGFLAGSVVAYVISVRWVFARRVVSSASAELAIFVLIGCFGLLVGKPSRTWPW